MSYQKEEIAKMINGDEPDYTTIMARLSESDIPILVELAKGDDISVATKAISCLGLMDTEAAVTGIETVIISSNPIIRVSAANALKHSTSIEASIPLLDRLLDDTDIGVRKFALKTVLHGDIKELKSKVKQLSENEETELMRDLSHKVYSRINR